jgi:BirA family biotin operon repressor/biotin-[acetyl-CoA-carboxylase] ligase
MSFDVNAVESEIAGTGFCGQIVHFSSIGSTNTVALEAAQAGARTGVWVADEQTAGRGRGGHQWYSKPGDGLYVSALVAPSLPMKSALLISLATGLAARQAIAETTELEADIRWPNDLLVHGRKCGGILVETSVAPPVTDEAEAMLRFAVIGVGINLNHETFPDEIARIATSLQVETGQAVSREKVLAALLRSLDRELIRLSTEPADRLLHRFEITSTWVRGKRVRVEEHGGYTGVTAGLNGSGFLLVNSDDGIRRTVLSGGVREQ